MKALPFCNAFGAFDGIFMDLVYGKPSAIFQSLKQKGKICQDGLPMLIEQARKSQELWWGEAAPFKEIFDHLIAG